MSKGSSEFYKIMYHVHGYYLNRWSKYLLATDVNWFGNNMLKKGTEHKEVGIKKKIIGKKSGAVPDITGTQAAF